MKLFTGLFLGVALFGLANCSHTTKMEPEVSNAPAVVDQSYSSLRQKDISDLQARLDGMKDRTGMRKFSGNRQNTRQFLNDEYARLGRAKILLRNIETAATPDTATKTQLDSEISGIRNDLDRRVAE